MFADGAVDAARFMVGKDAGLYNMEDFLGAEYRFLCHCGPVRRLAWQSPRGLVTLGDCRVAAIGWRLLAMTAGRKE
jgi:hypothetical protein